MATAQQVVVALITVASFEPELAAAQSRRASLSMSLAPSFYRISETNRGTALAAFGAFEWPIKGGLSLQAAGTMWTDSQHYQIDVFPFSESHTQFIPELGLQLAFGAGTLRPFAGGGLGLVVRNGFLPTRLTLYSSGGVAWRVREGWALRTETRLRSLGPFDGRTIDLSLGVTLYR